MDRAGPFPRSPLGPSARLDLCVVGNLTIDVILRGIEELPRWGQEVLGTSRTDTVAGQAGGLAFAARAVGIATEVVADVGEDEAGERIRRELGAAGVGVATVTTVPGGVTPMTVALVRPDGERAFVSDLGQLRDGTAGPWAPDWRSASGVRVVALVGTCNLPGFDMGAAARHLAEARRAGSLTVFDPGWDPSGWSHEVVQGIKAVLAEIDVFLPNLDEARALVGESSVSSILRALRDVCPGVVVVKDGSEGSYVIDGDRIVAVEALAAEVDNAVGAGDVYDAAVVAGFLRGRDVLGAMTLGTAAASLYVARRTDRYPTYEHCADVATGVIVRSL